jgi:hypothetical protein
MHIFKIASVVTLASAIFVALCDTASAGLSVVQVPEPATLSILAGGAVGVLALRRLRRK